MERSQEIIARLKAIRKAKGLTYQEIVDLTASIGEPVSLSTIRRVFGPDSDTYDFRYETTIQPIATVLLDADTQASGSEYTEVLRTENATLKSIIDLKNQTIEIQSRTITEKTAEIANHKSVLKHKNRVELFLSAAVVLMVLLFAMFYFFHTHTGFLVT